MALKRKAGAPIVIEHGEMQANQIIAGATEVSFPPTIQRRTPYEFGDLGLPGPFGSDLALAFLRYYRRLSGPSQSQAYGHLRMFASFVNTGKLRQYSDVMLDFFAYLETVVTPQGKLLSEARRHAIYNNVRLCLQTIDDRPLSVFLGSSFPRAPHRLQRDKSARDAKLSESQMENILEAAKTDIQRIRAVRPTNISHDVLFPYAVAIAIKTWANPSSVFGFDIDCCKEHPLDERLMVVQWGKPRAGKFQYRSFLKQAPFAPPRLINEVIDLTSAVRLIADQAIRNRLFLMKIYKYGRFQSIRSFEYGHIEEILANFIKRHSLSRFTMRDIRLSAIQGTLKKTKNVRITRKLANHASRLSTVRYGLTPETLELCNETISELQIQFSKHLLSDIATVDSTKAILLVDTAVAEAIVAGKNATLSGFTCKNPYEGVAPGSVAGEICPSFLSCFRCPNAVLGNDARAAAQLIQFRDAIRRDEKLMRPERFLYLYSWVVETLEQTILPLYNSKALEAGVQLAKELPELPSFVE